jgi:hypothetical protein
LEYEVLVRLDELETLLEDLEDELSGASSSSEPLSEEMQQRMDAAGVESAEELRNLIGDLHQGLDRSG